MASLSSRVIWASTWRTLVATGAAECTHGQVAVAVVAAAAFVAAVVTVLAPAAVAVAVAAIRARARAAVRWPLGISVLHGYCGTDHADGRTFPRGHGFRQ